MSAPLKIHVISDLRLGFNESAQDQHIIPDVDLVIINGNIGIYKRSMLYASNLSKKYPNIKFVYNFGELECILNRDDKEPNLLIKSTQLRKTAGDSWPSNLYWTDGEPFILDFNDGRKLDVLCTYGYPNIVKVDGDWKDTYWYKNYTILDYAEEIDVKDTEFKPEHTSNVKHGYARHLFRATKDYINKCHILEKNKVKEFELRQTATKLLITHINPFNDTRFINCHVRPYEIHLLDGYWVASNKPSNDTQFLGARLMSNPGRGVAREKIYTINVT